MENAYGRYFKKCYLQIARGIVPQPRVQLTVAETGISSTMITSPRSQWEKYICPVCHEFMDDPVQISCGHRMCYKCFRESWGCGDSWCPVIDDDGQRHKLGFACIRDNSWDSTAERKINKLLMKCNKCGVECTVKEYRRFDCSNAHRDIALMITSPRSQWEEYICPVCDELMDDPVQTSCGHRMCYKCFSASRKWDYSLCPVRDDDGQIHIMGGQWFKDRAVEKNINKLLVTCGKCEVKCTLKDYRKFHSPLNMTQGEWAELLHYVTSDCKDDLPHWRQLIQQNEYITPSELCGVTDDDELFTRVLSAMGCKGACVFQQCLEKCNCSDCASLRDDLRRLNMSQKNGCSTANADNYTKLASMKTFRELEKLPPEQQQKLITQVLKETLPAAKDDLFIDEIRPLLYEKGVITGEEAAELLGQFSGEDKVTRLYTKMLPKKGMDGLEKYMSILYDTGWDTPSHLRHHGVLLINLSDKLSQIKRAQSVLCQYDNEETAREAIVPMVYSDSLPDAVINLSKSINKLLLPMLRKRLVTFTEYCWLREFFCPGEMVQELYEELLPKKGPKGLRAFMEVLQQVGKNIPKYQKHRDLLKSRLQAHVSKV